MIELRPARREDIDHVARLERACFGPDDGIFSRRQLRGLLANPNAYCLLGADNHVMGCWLEAGNGRTRWARLYSLAVHPDLRGRGWAGRLLEAGFHWMQERGLSVCRAEVKIDNLPARSLYARHDFAEAQVLHDYYGTGLHGLRLVRHLPRRLEVAAGATLNHSA